MAPQDDLTAERAAALFRKLDEGLYYMREGGKSHQEQDQFGADLLLQFARQTRQEALLEGPSHLRQMAAFTSDQGLKNKYLDIANELDRLASEGG